jgi:threonine dehydrogenase-like Zn-dependent dehydrogenase
MQSKDKGKAAVWMGKRNIVIEEFPIPRAEKDGMVLKVDAAAICGTDGHLFPEDPPYPSILGHEVTGTIVEMGEYANKSINVFDGPLKVGDRVALFPWITCGKCPECIKYGSGTCTVCDNSFVYGVPYERLGLDGNKGINSDVNIYPHFMGGFAEYLYVFPETYVWKLPKDMPSEVAVLLDPMAVATRAIELAQTCPGTVEEAFNTNATVAIIGMGPVGILATVISRLMGVKKIIAIGGRKARLKAAIEIGQADEVIDIHEVSPSERIKEVKRLSGGKGADVVLQCANTSKAFIEGIGMMRRMGTLIEVGNMVNTGTTVSLDPAVHICAKHARIIGMSANTPSAFNKAFNILRRHHEIDFTKIYTHITNLENLGNTINKITDKDYVKGLVKFE